MGIHKILIDDGYHLESVFDGHGGHPTPSLDFDIDRRARIALVPGHLVPEAFELARMTQPHCPERWYAEYVKGSR